MHNKAAHLGEVRHLESVFIDHGTELWSAEVKGWCAEKRIASTYYAHSTHGPMQRRTSILGNALRCVRLAEGVLPEACSTYSFWKCAAAIRSLLMRNYPGATPWE
jgi:hypothetical protein